MRSAILVIFTLGLGGNVAIAAPAVTTKVQSNTCSSDFSMTLAKGGSVGSSDHYSSYSDKPFLATKSCEIKLKATVPAGYKLRLIDHYSRGDVTVPPNGSTLYGYSIRSGDDRIYTGSSKLYKKSESYQLPITPYVRGTGTACGRPVDLIIRHDAAPSSGAGSVRVKYHSFHAILEKC